MVDQATIQKLEHILDEKVKVIQRNDRARQERDDEIRELKDVID